MVLKARALSLPCLVWGLLWGVLPGAAGGAAATEDWVAWEGKVELGPPGEQNGWARLLNSDLYSERRWEVAGVPNAYRYHHTNATHYTLGRGLVELEVWHPFPDNSYDGAVSANFRGALYEMYHHELSAVRVKLVNSDWGKVGTATICRDNAPCPNVILVGDSQVPGRVAAKNALRLNEFFDQFLKKHMRRLPDDFPSLAYYQYNLDGNWRAMPLMTDTRLLRFNMTALDEMGEEYPPPHGRRPWAWSDFVDLVCRISDRYGHGWGLRALSDFNEDFKLAMLMAQSSGVYLLNNSTCGLRNEKFEAVVDLWKRLMNDGCVSGGHVGENLTYWKGVSPPSAALKATIVADLNASSPPEQAHLSQYFSIGEKDLTSPFEQHGPGFFFQTGLDESPPGLCSIATGKRRYGYEGQRHRDCQHLGNITGANATSTVCAQRMFEWRGNSFLLRPDGLCQVLKCRRAPHHDVDGWEVWSTHCSSLAYADMPGKYTFLGGSGLIIPTFAQEHFCDSDAAMRARDDAGLRPAGSTRFKPPGGCGVAERKQEDERINEGWRIMLELTNRDKPWIQQMNGMKYGMMLPPVASIISKLTSEEKWKPAVDALRRAIPPQYPSNPLVQSGEIDTVKPLRIALLRAIYGNFTTEQAVNDGCDVLDQLVRPCNRSRWRDDAQCRNLLDDGQGCRAGEYFPRGEAIPKVNACRPCPAGTFQPARNVESVCMRCSYGEFSMTVGATACSPCQPGYFTQGLASTQCYACEVGKIPSADRASCTACETGLYLDGFECKKCPRGKEVPAGKANFGVQECSLVWQVHVQNFLLVITTLLLVFFLNRVFFNSIPVLDIHLESGHLAVTTSVSHRVLRNPWGPVRVRLRGTGHQSLDCKTFRAAYKSVSTLYLLDNETGQAMVTRADTSMGELRIVFPYSLVCTGEKYWPTGLSLGLIVVCIATLFYEINDRGWIWAQDWLIASAIIALAAAGFTHSSKVRRFQILPIAQRRSCFRSKLQLANPNPKEVQRGPGRAVSMGQVWELYQSFQDFILDRDMYYVASNVLRPLTEPVHLSYAELAGPSDVEWFVSHYWGQEFKDFVASLRKHAEYEGRMLPSSWEDITFWICSFSNNQWQVEAELGEGNPMQSSFYLALTSRTCRGTAMVMDRRALPLTRSWCLFEVFQTCRMTALRTDFTGLLLCTPTGVLQRGGTGVDAAVTVAQRLSTLDLELADATSLEDKRMIDDHVRRMTGGFKAMNRFVRGCIKEALYAVHASFEADFESLVLALDNVPEGEEEEAPVHAQTAPRLLGRGRSSSRHLCRSIEASVEAKARGELALCRSRSASCASRAASASPRTGGQSSTSRLSDMSTPDACERRPRHADIEVGVID